MIWEVRRLTVSQGLGIPAQIVAMAKDRHQAERIAELLSSDSESYCVWGKPKRELAQPSVSSPTSPDA